MTIRVLHLIPWLSGGGAERQFQLLAPRLALEGLDVHVLAHDGGPAPPTLEPVVSVHMLRRRHRHPLLPLELRTVVREIAPDILHTWLPAMDILGGATARLTGLPWVMTERASALAYPNSPKHALRSRCARFARVVVANSQAGADLWRRHPMVRVIPNAVDTEGINVSAPVVGTTAPFVLYAGRLAREKNLGTMCAAFNRVIERSSLRVVICGDGADRPQVEALLARHIAAGRVVLTGHTDEVWSYMKAAVLYFSASFFEGSPNAVLEAIACQCPLVLTDIPAHREIVDEHSAWLVPVDDPVSQANAILEAASRPEWARAKTARAQAALTGREPRSVAAAYAALYDDVLRRQVSSPGGPAAVVRSLSQPARRA